MKFMEKIFKIRIMVFGTFDVLHKGHLNFLKQARALAKNPYLIVSIARDANVKKIKGQRPALNQHQRLDNVKKCGLAEKCVLGGLKDYLPHILKEQPSVIALGYDQTAYVDNLKRDLGKAGLRLKIRRLKAFKPRVHKSSLLKRKVLK